MTRYLLGFGTGIGLTWLLGVRHLNRELRAERYALRQYDRDARRHIGRVLPANGATS